MRLSQLQIKYFRNLENVQLTPVNGVNLIVGDNASGKTSLLEAIYYLSHIRSFRTQFVTDLIQRQNPYLQLVANLESQDGNTIPVGIRRSKSKTEIRANKQAIKRVSDITAQFPVLAIHPDSYILISGSPSQRRQFLDWGVFHVEHGFFQTWQRFKTAILQRNASLKSKQQNNVCQLWNKEIVNSANYIDQLRRQYFEKLQPYVVRLAHQFFIDDIVDIEYKRGWPVGKDLHEILTNNIHRDRLRGYTSYGPHRAEINIKVNGQSAQTCISRGQQKTLVAVLRLAQAMQFTESTKKLCVLLYDDLAAELDAQHRKLILNELSSMNIQLFITAIEESQIDLSAWHIKKKFHVEHGQLKDLI